MCTGFWESRPLVVAGEKLGSLGRAERGHVYLFIYLLISLLFFWTIFDSSQGLLQAQCLGVLSQGTLKYQGSTPGLLHAKPMFQPVER